MGDTGDFAMLKIWDANNFRRTLAGLCLIVGPLVGLIGAFVGPQYLGSLREELAAISENPGGWMIGNFMTLISYFLLIPAVLGLVHLLSDRSVTLGHIGGALVLLGLYFHAAVVGYSLVELPLTVSEIEWSTLLSFTEQTYYNHTAFTMLLLPFLGFYVGSIILAIALWRGRVVPLWIALVIVAALVSEFIGPEAWSPQLMFALLFIGFGWIGVKMLRMADLEWQQGQVSGEPQSRVR
jgi:hypothetical protein